MRVAHDTEYVRSAIGWAQMHMQDLWLEDIIHVEQTFVLLNIASSGVLIWYDRPYITRTVVGGSGELAAGLRE